MIVSDELLLIRASQDAYPTWFAFKTYGGLIVVQLLLAWIMPGVDQEGMAALHNDVIFTPTLLFS